MSEEICVKNRHVSVKNAREIKKKILKKEK